MVEDTRATVFYSWQSDLPNSVNRGFIQQALERAAKTIRNDASIHVEPVVERDTQNVPGSPQIADAIFEKIASADVFVADVTFIANGKRPRKGSRPCPNPNVLVELGYAARAIGWDRIVLVMNTHFGRVEHLPFDLRMRRTLSYVAAPAVPEKAVARHELEGRLESALKEILLRRNSMPPAPSVLLAATSSIESAKPDQVACARDFMRQFTQRLVNAAPQADPSRPLDEPLIDSLQASVPMVADFARLSETVARHGAGEACLAVVQGFGEILQRYRFPARQGGSFMDTDFDHYKFVGHETFVLLVAALIRNEKWELLSQVLEERFAVETNDGSRNEGFWSLSVHLKLLEARNERLQLRRISLHGDLLKERYQAEPLASLCSFREFLEADWFLFFRTDLAPQESPIAKWGAPLWRPWSCVYAESNGAPRFLALMERKKVAERILPALGLASIEQLRARYHERARDLAGMFRGRGFFEPPVVEAARLGSL